MGENKSFGNGLKGAADTPAGEILTPGAAAVAGIKGAGSFEEIVVERLGGGLRGEGPSGYDQGAGEEKGSGCFHGEFSWARV